MVSFGRLYIILYIMYLHCTCINDPVPEQPEVTRHDFRQEKF